MNKKYVVRLTDDERQAPIALPKTGQAAASQIKHAHILLQVDAHGPHWSDAHVAKAFRGHGHTVRNGRQRSVAQGVEAAGIRKKPVHPSRQRLLEGAKEAHVMALRCSQPPPGVAKWTLKVLADTLVTLNVVATLSDATVRQSRKKTRSRRPDTRVRGCPRSPMPTVWPPWKMSWLSLSVPMSPSTRWLPWMQSRCSSCRKRARPGPPSLASHGGTRTPMNGSGRPTCCCAPSPCQGGGRSPSPLHAPLSTGRTSSSPCWMTVSPMPTR